MFTFLQTISLLMCACGVHGVLFVSHLPHTYTQCVKYMHVHTHTSLPIASHSPSTSTSTPLLLFLHPSPPPLAEDVATASGSSDFDYPTLASQVPALAALPYVGDFKHTPLPPELIEHFDRILTLETEMGRQGG